MSLIGICLALGHAIRPVTKTEARWTATSIPHRARFSRRAASSTRASAIVSHNLSGWPGSTYSAAYSMVICLFQFCPMADEPFQIFAIGVRRQRDAQAHGRQRARCAGTGPPYPPVGEEDRAPHAVL